MIAVIFALIAALLGFGGSDAGLITEPAPSAYELEADIVCGPYEWLDEAGTGCAPLPGYESDEWGEVPILPTAAYYPPAMCLPVPANEASDAALEYLVGQGYQGWAGDGMEALYPPGCAPA